MFITSQRLRDVTLIMQQLLCLINCYNLIIHLSQDLLPTPFIMQLALARKLLNHNDLYQLLYPWSKQWKIPPFNSSAMYIGVQAVFVPVYLWSYHCCCDGLWKWCYPYGPHVRKPLPPLPPPPPILPLYLAGRDLMDYLMKVLRDLHH